MDGSLEVNVGKDALRQAYCNVEFWVRIQHPVYYDIRLNYGGI